MRDQGESALVVTLETLVHERITSWKNKEENLWCQFGSISRSLASGNDKLTQILIALTNIDRRVLILNLATVTSVDLNEQVHEVADVRLLQAGTNDDNTPRLQWLCVREQELLSTEIPATRVAWSGLCLVVLDFWRGKNESLGLGHILIDLHTVVLEVWVLLPSEHVDAILN